MKSPQSWTILLCRSVTKKRKNQSSIHVTSRSRRNSSQRVDPKQCTTWPSLGHKSLQDTRKVLKLKFHLYSKIKAHLQGCERCRKVRQRGNADPRRKSFGDKPAAEARPILKPSSTSNWNFIPLGQKKWIDFEVKRFKDPYCFQMSKFTTQLLRHEEVGREEDAGVPCSRIVDKSKEVLSDDSRYWSDEIKEKMCMAPYWSADKWRDGSVKKWWTEEKVAALCETKVSRKTLKPSSCSRSFRKRLFWKCSYPYCIARQCTVTKGVYQVCLSRRKREGIEINGA